MVGGEIDGRTPHTINTFQMSAGEIEKYSKSRKPPYKQYFSSSRHPPPLIFLFTHISCYYFSPSASSGPFFAKKSPHILPSRHDDDDAAWKEKRRTSERERADLPFYHSCLYARRKFMYTYNISVHTHKIKENYIRVAGQASGVCVV